MSQDSALYVGKVKHTRTEPLQHSFTYRVFYGLFDIDRLEDLDRKHRWFSLGRFNLMSFDESDYGPADGSPLRPWVEQTLEGAGVNLEGGRILLLTFPRILGFVFNPLSIWYCYGPSGDLRGVIHEVRNTFGDKHSYVVPVDREGMSHSFDKRLHVSPFNGMDHRYEFSLTEPGTRLTVSINQSGEDGARLMAGMALSRAPFTDSQIIRVFFSHPLLTLKVVSAIHIEALKLWFKGARFHRRPEPASNSITVVTSEKASV